MIYIHNSYDEWNLVTCVHPTYYAKNIRINLVYLPYFVLNEMEPDNQVSIDKMEHFVWTPGVIYADEVILQSDKMKQIYANEYIKSAKENRISGTHIDRKIQEKFKGIGSPKFDRIQKEKC